MNVQTVYVTCPGDSVYIVEGFNLFGKRIICRQFAHGRKRKEWAMEYAKQIADRYYLWLDPKIYY